MQHCSHAAWSHSHPIRQQGPFQAGCRYVHETSAQAPASLLHNFSSCGLAFAFWAFLGDVGSSSPPTTMKGPEFFRNTVTWGSIKLCEEGISKHALSLEHGVQTSSPEKSGVPGAAACVWKDEVIIGCWVENAQFLLEPFQPNARRKTRSCETRADHICLLVSVQFGLLASGGRLSLA
jgi:hypothetical protein